MRFMIYGAKALAFGIYTAVKELYPEHSMQCFLVSSLQNNPAVLAGLPVRQIADVSDEMEDEQKSTIRILIGTPEDMHQEIEGLLKKYHFYHYTCMDSRKEAHLMEQYFSRKKIFPSIHQLQGGADQARLQVYMAKFYKDRALRHTYDLPEWISFVQVGAELTDVRVSNHADNLGQNISAKNGNYCELTALYWIWKNRLTEDKSGLNNDQENDVCKNIEYYGLFHYRRILDITDEDLYRLKACDVDVVLQFPTLHDPDISEHHARYMKEKDWKAMLTALWELQPDYAKAFLEILAQPYFYNYNLIIAKWNVLSAYCEWLFPILERTEELSHPKGSERADRYIGYLGENLMTLYFLYNHKKWKIFHTGRLMLI